MPPRIALVSRELHPFIGGGIAPIVRATAQVLASAAEVTLVTTAAHRARHEQLSAAEGELFPHVRVVFVEEPPEGRGHYYDWLQAYSHRVFETLLTAYPDGGPDLIEFPDYLAEGFVTIQAKRTAEPALRDTRIAVRTHTTGELVAVLNGHLATDAEACAVRDMERYCLRNADTLLWPGGDVLATYQRFYGVDALAPATEIPDAFLIHREEDAPDVERSGPLKLLFLGRMERRKGVQNLLRALPALEHADWRLTLMGGDTRTAPLGHSVAGQLSFGAALEERIDVHDPVPREQVGRMIAAHDALIVPSLWECWPNVAREALLHDRPIIATPVGGLVAFARPGVSGWLARDASAEALADVLEPLVADPEQVRALSRSGGPRRVLDELTDPEMIRSRYLALCESDGGRRSAPRRRRSQPLVSVVVPYYRMDAYVEDTLQSIAAQTHPHVETVVVNDGSLRDEDRMLELLADRYGARLVTQRNRGLGAARNFGVANARGSYVLPLDSDDLIDPDFVERCLAALEADGDLAYVGTWSRYVDEQLRPIAGANPGYTPLGNWSALAEEQNAAGSASALIRRSLFDAGFRYSTDLVSYEDWLFYLRLARAGHYGGIIPRPLLQYRIRSASMLRATGAVRWERLRNEVATLLLESTTRWTAGSSS
ncbi:MAG: glycogen synthase [Solirubrobacteraceae bacterium]|nr:glycogen synthase [Solirubrobacteraceae bacterium]